MQALHRLLEGQRAHVLPPELHHDPWQRWCYLTVPSPDPVSRRDCASLPTKAEQVTKAVWPRQKAWISGALCGKLSTVKMRSETVDMHT